MFFVYIPDFLYGQKVEGKMVTAKEEYDSLRQELLEHQQRRLTILGLILPICLALFAASVQLKIYFLPLGALILLHMARMQIAEAQYGIARIAAYIRIVIETNNPSMNWEYGSFWTKNYKSKSKSKAETPADLPTNKGTGTQPASNDKANPKSNPPARNASDKKRFNFFPLAYLDWIIFLTGLVAIVISFGIPFINMKIEVLWWVCDDPNASPITNSIAAALWCVIWVIFSIKYQNLATTKYEAEEAEKWKEFDLKKSELKAQNARIEKEK
jgi:hypothetical protein